MKYEAPIAKIYELNADIIATSGKTEDQLPDDEF